MKRAIKWTAIIGGSLLVIVVLALLIIPQLVDVQKYKPQIEKQVAAATGRSFSVGDDLKLSLFPWAGVSFSNLSLGNPPGFKEDKFVTVQSFKMQVKLLPLLSKDVQVKRFLLKGARIVLEKNKDGKVNWKFETKTAVESQLETKPEKKAPPAGEPAQGLPFKSLVVGDFTITDSAILWIDHAKKQRQEISNVNLNLKNVSLERPFQVAFSALADGKPLELQGQIGPLGKDLKKADVAVDLTFRALKQLEVGLKGRVVNPAQNPNIDLGLKVASFSPRKLLAALKQPFPVKTADPKALNSISFNAMIKADSRRVRVSDGLADIDGSKLKLSLDAREFSKPNVTFSADLNNIDLDRYLPPEEKKPTKGTAKGQGTQSESKGQTAKTTAKPPTDYSPLRKVVLDGSVKIGKLKVKNAKMERVRLKIKGKNGIFNLEPFSIALYQGDVAGKASLNVQKNTPRTSVKLDAKGIQAGPLLNDVIKKDIIEGILKAEADIALSGDTPEMIKKTISGKGDLLFRDGAIKGIDLAGMVRNVQTAFGLAAKSDQKPKTDFAEFHVPFAVKRGVVNTTQTRLLSPLVRVAAAGKTDLVKESLDFRVEPKFVGTLRGQGDTMDRSGIMVPVLVSGTFAAPKFKPDLEGLVKKNLEQNLGKKLEDLQKNLLNKDKQKDQQTPVENLIKGFFKKLPFGK